MKQTKLLPTLITVIVVLVFGTYTFYQYLSYSEHFCSIAIGTLIVSIVFIVLTWVIHFL